MTKTQKIITILLVTMLLAVLVPATDTKAAGKPKLNKTTLTLFVGQSEKLKVSNLTASSSIKWSVKNSKIAKVNNNGKVTAKKKGRTLVYATIGKRKLKCTVTIKSKPFLNTTNVTLQKNNSFKLVLKGTKAIKWTSSDKSVATVSKKGKVTAVNYGTAVITAKDSNNKTYKCKISVVPKNRSIVFQMLYVAVNDDTFDVTTDFRRIDCDKDFYTIEFVQFLPEIKKGKKQIKYDTEFDITKEGQYLAQYKVTSALGEVQYWSRVIEVIDDAEFVNSLDQ